MSLREIATLPLTSFETPISERISSVCPPNRDWQSPVNDFDLFNAISQCINSLLGTAGDSDSLGAGADKDNRARTDFSVKSYLAQAFRLAWGYTNDFEEQIVQLYTFLVFLPVVRVLCSFIQR